MKLKKYDKIKNLYRAESQSIFSLSQVVITEKIDGTNFSFGIQDGCPVMNSRNNRMYIKKDNVENHILQFDGFGAVNKFKELFGREKFDELRDLYPKRNLQIFGEFYGNGIQRRINYGNEKYFAFFDVYDLDKQEYFVYDEFYDLCVDLKLPMVHLFGIIKPKLSVLEKIIKSHSPQSKINGVEEEQPIEGIVIKGLYNEKDKWDERVITKYKTEKFAEISKQKHKSPKIPKENLDKFKFAEYICEKYMTEARLENCLEKLRGENVVMSIKTTGRVISYLCQDVIDELELEDKDSTLLDGKFVNKLIGAKCAQLYHKYLENENK